MLIALKNKIHPIIKSTFVRNVAVVATGTAGAQAITIAFAPLITRLYGPEAFGILGTFMALLNVVIPVAALSYPIAIVLPKEDSDAKGIAKLSAYIALGITGSLSLMLLIGGDWLVELLRVQEISSFIFLIPLAMLFAAFVQVARQWLIRKKQFGITARVDVFNAFTVNAAKTGFGFFYPVAAVLIIFATIGHAIQAVMLGAGIKRSNSYKNTNTDEKTTTPKILALAKKHYDFPLYRCPQIFINAVSLSLPVLMLSAFFGPASAGFYVIGKRILGLPSSLIGKSVHDVFYPRISEAAHKGKNLSRLIVKATLGLVATGILPFSVVILFGPIIFGFVFGSEWVTAGEYARWISLWLFSSFINRPSVSAIPVLKLQGYFLIYEIVSIALRLGALLIGFYIFNDDILAIILFSIAGFIVNIFLILLTVYRSKSYIKIDRNM